jgi:uncharacterized protein
MFEKLSHQLDVALLSRKGHELSFVLKAKELERLSQVTLGVLSDAKGVLQFSLFEGCVPQVQLTARVLVSLVCQRTLATFDCPLEVSTVLVFADENAADWTEEQEVLLPEEMNEDPRVWIEDSLLLALPLVPVQPGTHPVEYEVGEVVQIEDKQKPNPFATLKVMMKKE